jgi:alpha-D-xyloside xylohydrolase
LDAGQKYHIRLDWSKDQGMPNVRLLWKTPSTSTATSLWSEVGDGVDYYFLNGPSIDNVVAGYRKVTGKAPLMPIWAMGLWQSRQRYETSQASLDVVNEFRSRSIPFDNIVQDWFYWKELAWGSHEFDPARFPDPQGWIDAIHALHANLMISVWGKFYPGTENFQAMDSHKYLYESDLAQGLHDWLDHRYTFYDAFNAGARKLFWSQLNRELFAKHVDAWWLDATEPDLLSTPTLDGQRTNLNPTALGSGSRMLNGYSLMQSESIYDGQRAAAPDQRVVILTRSAFAGQQRYSAATWSGDITSTWTAMRKQIPAGLGFCLSGVPWWTMDTGGFAVPPRFSRRDPADADLQEWRELNARWFEFGTFVPLLRVHGEFPYREMWQFGGDQSPTFQAELKFDRLRYRLLPYIYSLAADVTQHDGTIMRALVMDFPADAKARNLSDQYMFGPAFLVSPVTEYKARDRQVYLPQSAGWYDFWTGAYFNGGQTITAAAPYDSIPLQIKAGSIIPLGPELQYTTEKPADPITLYVYSGADGSFSLYDDDGVSNDYEHGKFTRITLNWNDAAKTLTIGKREGSFPKMLTDRTFNVVLISKDHPVGFSFTPQSIQTIQYNGDETSVQLN